MSRTEIRKSRLSSVGPFALFSISVPPQDVTNKLSFITFTLSSDTTQWCGSDLLPVGKPLKMDSHYLTVHGDRDSVRPCSHHLGITTGLTVSNYTNVQVGLWHSIRFCLAIITFFVPRFSHINHHPETCRRSIQPSPHQNLVRDSLRFWPRRQLG
jgi:hypothetical protein